MKIKLLASAQQDLLDGYGFYEQQAQGIGEYFLDSLYSDIESLIVTSGIHSLFYERYFRLLSKHFPFAVYYTVSKDTVLVYAILDCRRKPAWTRVKLKI